MRPDGKKKENAMEDGSEERVPAFEAVPLEPLFFDACEKSDRGRFAEDFELAWS